MKVSWLSWHFASPKIFLDSIRKMTPNCSGNWLDMESVLDPYEADYVIIMDGYNGKVPQDKVIYVGAHPRVEGFSPAFRKWEDKHALLKLHLDDNVNPGEWWIKHTYDELVNLPIPQKDKKLCCIMTYQTHNTMYAQRPKFMQEFCSKYPNLVDIYGRPEERFRADTILSPYYKGSLGFNKPNGVLGEHLIGKEVVGDYKFSLEFDVGPTRNYFSERFFDALLLWTKPIYFGSNNVHEFIPSNAFSYVNIHNLNDISRVRAIVETEPDYEAIAEARNLLLNKYNMFPYIYNKIKGLK